MIKEIIAAGIGFVACAFCPAIGRAIKALFVKKSTAVVASAVASVAPAVVAEVKKVI